MSTLLTQLTETQRNLLNRIIDIGADRGASLDMVEAAVHIANAESTFNLTAQNPDSTAYGLFQYLDGTWEERWAEFQRENPSDPLAKVSTLEARNNIDAQIAVMFSDLADWHEGFHSGQLDPRFGDKLNQLEAAGYDARHNFLYYAYLKHNTDPAQVLEVIPRDFIPNSPLGDHLLDLSTWSRMGRLLGVTPLQDSFEKAFKDIVDDTFGNAQTAPPPRLDPLILDLDGDGIETANTNDAAFFDHDGNGFAEQTGWVGADDGMLAWDRDGDGRINDGKELFGDQTVLQDGTRAASGFQAIAEWDDNADGKIDASDGIWANLKIWQDTDGDGYTLAGELKDLAALGIQSINLGHTVTNTIDAQGNIQARLGSFTKSDGTAGQMGDYLLDRNTTYTLAREWLDVPEGIADLPILKGYGNVYDLHQAMVRDVGGALKTLVQAFSTQTTTTDRNADVEAILFKWTGSDTIDPTSRGPNIDARRLVVLEKFDGQSFAGTTGANPNPNAASLLNQAYQGLYEMVSAQLMAQTHLKGLYDIITYTWNESTQSLQGNLSGVITEIQNRLVLDPVSGQALLSEFVRTVVALRTEASLNFEEFRTTLSNQGEQLAWVVESVAKNVMTGTATADSLSGIGGSDAIQGGDGNDTLFGNAGSDVLYGEAGADTLYGNAGDDLLLGGSDNDSLDGGLGNDVYLFGRGSGRDTVYDYDTTAGNTDVIRLAADVLPSDVVVWRGTSDLYLSIGAVTGSEDRIAITNWFTSTANRIERIEFADGTVWGTALLTTAPILGTTGNDTLYGTVGDDLIDGGAGNDMLHGYTNGSYDSGNDTYLFGTGAGQDIISDYGSTADNVDTVKIVSRLPSEVSLYRGLNASNSPSNDLVLKLNGTSDQLTIQNYYSATEYKVEKVQFDDGTVWTLSQMEDLPLLPSTATAYGTSGSETFDLRNVANTTAYGYTTSGNDTYLFGTGAGRDTISDYGLTTGNVDTVKIVGKLPSEVTLYRGLDASNSPSNDLVLKLNGTPDQLTIQDYYSASQYKVERVVFDDGTVWTLSQMEGLPLLPSGATAYGTSGSETFDLRNVANTMAYGYTTSGYDSGNDTYLFGTGAGRDTISDYGLTTGNVDTVKIVGKLPSEVTLYRGLDASNSPSNDLVLKLNGTPDQLTIQDYYSASQYKVERVVFDDGTVWTLSQMEDLPLLPSTATAYGTSGSETFDLRNVANTTAYGYTSSGYDSGNDTYLFGTGAGRDTISDYGLTTGNVDTVKIVGKLPSEVTLYRGLDASNSPSNDLVLKLNGTSDQLTIQNYFVAGGAYKVEKVQFDDGTVWTLSQMEGLPLLPSGALAYGTSGSETFDLRNVANTTAYGYTTSAYDSGNDTYLFGVGAGQDIISDYGSIAGNMDTVKIVGKLPSEVTLYRGLDASNSPSNDLVLKLNGTPDQLTIQDYYSASQYKVERVVFDDGTVWTLSQMEGLPLLPSGALAYGTSGSETFDLRNVANTTAYGYTTSAYDSGNDTYLFGVGAGQDIISDFGSIAGNMDTVKIVGKLPSEISVSRRVDESGNLTNDLVLKINSTSDQLTLQNYFVAGGAYKVEKVQFDDGTVWGMALLGSAAIMGTAVANTLSGSADADLIRGLEGNDILSGNAGNDIMQGGADNDTISDTSGNNLFDGGAGIDILTGGSGKELFIGGAANDTITTGLGADIIAFNRGDGQDIVNASTGADNTLSLGGGIHYTDLRFSKSANDLMLGLGNAEQITLKNWYATSANNKSVLNLQMIAEAMADFDTTSSDPLRNNKVETFNFGGLADRFDQARAADASLTSWSLTNALLDFHLGGSETAALGGDLAYQYGKTGTLAGLGVTPVQSVLSHAQFGTTPQALQPLATLQEGLVKLG